MITIQKVDKSYFELYDKIPMNVDVRSELQLRRIDGGLGGMKNAYASEPGLENEVQLIWTLELK